MKNSFIFFCSLTLTSLSFGQSLPKEYVDLCKKADSLYKAKDYKNSAFTYSSAFKANGWKGAINDRYNAACSWALANIPDSAFFYLSRAVFIGGYTSYDHISTDTDLASLHDDKRWKPLLEKVKENKDKTEANLNKPLAQRLDSILKEDQEGRKQLDGLAAKYGWESKEIQALWKSINLKDSLNLIKVTAILDQYGWLGPDVVGGSGNSALFLVIQHSDQKTQEKYLPMMREAVKNGKAHGSSLALLEDRVALRQGKKQIYGSQIGRDTEKNTHYVLPLEDPDNVDKRRAKVGLAPLSDYVSHWQIKWNVEEYKKNLPGINDTCKILSVKVDNAGTLVWTVKNGPGKKPFIIEDFRWNKWIKVGEVESVGTAGIQTYSFRIIPHSGENQMKVTRGEELFTSKEIKWIAADIPVVKLTLQKQIKEIQFTHDTMFEILDANGNRVKRGFGPKVSYKDIPAGTYTLNYDNSTTELKL
jgi:hypothetical protein